MAESFFWPYLWFAGSRCRKIGSVLEFCQLNAALPPASIGNATSRLCIDKDSGIDMLLQKASET